MINNIEKFVRNIKEKGFNKKGSIYAQIAKGERLKRHQTLEEVADGICSVSYLCKMENDTLLPPVTFIKTLFEKMDLDYETISNDDFEDSLEKALEYFFIDSEKLMKFSDVVLKYEASPTIKLVKCLINLKQKNYTELLEDLEELNTIKDTLGGLEAITLIYVALKYYINISYYERAYSYLKTLDYFIFETKYLKFLLVEANLEVSLNMNLHNRFLNFYYLLNTFEYASYSFEKRITADIMYNHIISNEYYEEALKKINIYDLKCLNKDSLYYCLAFLSKNYNRDEVYRYVIKNNLIVNDDRLNGLIAYIIIKDYLEDSKVIKERFDLLMDLYSKLKDNRDNKIIKTFMKFAIMVISNIDEAELLVFLRNEYVPIANKYYNILFDSVYKEVYLYLLGNKSQYKEAYCYLLNNLKLNFKR